VTTAPEMVFAHDAAGVAPLVSVVVVNYNGERYLRMLLPSLLAQTYPRVEVIVVFGALARRGRC